MEQQLDTIGRLETTVQKVSAFSFRYWEAGPGVADITSGSSYDVIFNCGPSIRFSIHQSDSNVSHCDAGNVISILAPHSKKQILLEATARFFQVAIDPDFMTEWFGSEKVDFSASHNFSSPFLAQLMSSLCVEASKGQIVEKRHTASLVMALVNELYCQFRASGKKCFSPKGKLSSQQMKKVIDLVKSSMHSEIHLSSMASEVHLSDFHFSRLFRNTFGISPYQYVLQAKVEYAKTLLRHYPRSLSQIAHSLNFTDQSHFTNVFKKLTGICPSDFAMNRVKSVA